MKILILYSSAKDPSGDMQPIHAANSDTYWCYVRAELVEAKDTCDALGLAKPRAGEITLNTIPAA